MNAFDTKSGVNMTDENQQKIKQLTKNSFKSQKKESQINSYIEQAQLYLENFT